MEKNRRRYYALEALTTLPGGDYGGVANDYLVQYYFSAHALFRRQKHRDEITLQARPWLINMLLLLFVFVPIRFVFIRVGDSGLFVRLVHQAHRLPSSLYIIIYNEDDVKAYSLCPFFYRSSNPFTSLYFSGT